MKTKNQNLNKTRVRSTAGRWLVPAFLVCGLVLAVLVGADGSAGWRLVRIVVVCIAAFAALWTLNRKPRIGALLAILFGIAGLIIGIVFGFRFLMVDGLSWRIIVGLIGLAAGIILLFLGIKNLLSGLRIGWKIIAVPVMVIVIAVVTWTMLPAVLATNVPPIALGQATPQDYGLKAQEVHFPAADGIDLRAWYVPSTNKAAVVLRHGSGSTSSDALPQAAVLARHGYGVLITDARGHGGSSGRAMDFGWYGDADIQGAVDFLINQPGVDSTRIGVAGLSMGGEEAIGAIAGDWRIAAVVAEGATGRTEADKAWLSDVYGFRGSVQRGLEWVEYSLTDLLTDASKPVALSDAVRLAVPRPILLIAAGKVEDEPQAAKYIQSQSPDTVIVWTIPDSGHIGGLSSAPAEWERTVIEFLDNALIK